MSLFLSNERMRRINYKGKDIFLMDYSGLKEAEMIALTNQHTQVVVTEGKESYFIANYEDTYGTPDYMKAAHAFTKATKPFISKGAFLGIRGPKVALLKGVTFFLQVNFKAFQTEQEALDFLVSE
jgi:hypothetical protein